MSVRKRGDNWVVDVQVGGNRVQKVVGPNKAEARALEAKVREEMRKGEFFGFSRKSVSFPDLVAQHLKLYREMRSYETEVALLKAALREWKYKRADQITTYDIVSFRSARLATPTRNKTKRKASSCNREIAALHRVFQSAVKWKIIRANPVSGVKPLEEIRGRTRFLSIEEARSLLTNCADHLKPIVAVALGTGMRRGEILGLKWTDIDFKRGMIYVRQSQSKTASARYVPMSGAVKDVFLSLPPNGQYVFCTKGGQRYGDNRTAFSNACKKAGIEDLRFHDLRHTAASHMVMSGVPMRTVGDILGHRSETMTERYSHLLPEHLLNAVESLPDWRERSDDAVRERTSGEGN